MAVTIITEIEIEDFQAWSGAVDTLETIVEAGKASELDLYVSELWPDGMTEVTLNDLLWHDREMVFEALGLSDEDEDEDEDESEDDDPEDE